jgi:predicted Zn finger-like uncharacterized protein
MPVLAVCDGCRAEYRLKDEHAGKKVKCKQCGSVILVPLSPESDEAGRLAGRKAHAGPFGYDRFLINQKRISISEKYYVYDEAQNPILFIERPAHFWRSIGAAMAGVLVAIVGILCSVVAFAALQKTAETVGVVLMILGFVLSIAAMIAVIIWLIPKRHISIYTDDTKANLLLEIFQDQKVSFLRATYTVRDPAEGFLGRLQKNYLYNLFRKRWDAFKPDGSPLVVAREDSLILSLLRRLFGPMLGLLRTNFVYLRPNTTTVLGEFNRKYTLFDRYVLDLTADRAHEVDRRLAVALGILLDTGERR